MSIWVGSVLSFEILRAFSLSLHGYLSNFEFGFIFGISNWFEDDPSNNLQVPFTDYFYFISLQWWFVKKLRAPFLWNSKSDQVTDFSMSCWRNKLGTGHMCLDDLFAGIECFLGQKAKVSYSIWDYSICFGKFIREFYTWSIILEFLASRKFWCLIWWKKFVHSLSGILERSL